MFNKYKACFKQNFDILLYNNISTFSNLKKRKITIFLILRKKMIKNFYLRKIGFRFYPFFFIRYTQKTPLISLRLSSKGVENNLWEDSLYLLAIS